ncbi:putative PAP-specific phosphatase, mitochondrial [Morus notabilis]|uniref:putative PAP-specific phosphatase, mitochondrial n=1 Tax=Morus notabilis TaxID=981085 RepID=UPI000CED7AE3|nr:putative PAP-specific phosphatase, mitochondrial [Morus notabilis]
MGFFTSASHFSTVRFTPSLSSPAPLRRRFYTVRSSLPFPGHKAKYHGELEAAVEVVERACRLCLDVKSSLFSSDGRIIEKNDQTPVTVADFGVQALVSLELGNLFPSIPLVAEEDSASVRSNNLADLVVNAVTGNSSVTHRSCKEADVLRAIDRGGKDAFTFGSKPATYWLGVRTHISLSIKLLKERVGKALTFMFVVSSLCKYLMVASGRASVFILRAKVQTTIKAWDHAVGMICVHEAGGKVTDWKGSHIDLTADESGRRIIYPSGGVLVTNGNLHNRIIELISCATTV